MKGHRPSHPLQRRAAWASRASASTRSRPTTRTARRSWLSEALGTIGAMEPLPSPAPIPHRDHQGRRLLAGRSLRYALTLQLHARGAMTLAELVAAVEGPAQRIDGRASKAASDALRWEVARGRVVRLGRGRYGPGRIPESTHRWIAGWLRRWSAG